MRVFMDAWVTVGLLLTGWMLVLAVLEVVPTRRSRKVVPKARS